MKKNKKLVIFCTYVWVINLIIYTYLYFDIDSLFLTQTLNVLKVKISILNIPIKTKLEWRIFQFYNGNKNELNKREFIKFFKD